MFNMDRWKVKKNLRIYCFAFLLTRNFRHSFDQTFYFTRLLNNYIMVRVISSMELGLLQQFGLHHAHWWHHNHATPPPPPLCIDDIIIMQHHHQHHHHHHYPESWVNKLIVLLSSNMYTDVWRQKAGSTTPVQLCKQIYCFRCR